MNNTEYDKVKTKFQNLQGKIDSLYCELQDINSRLYNLYDDIRNYCQDNPRKHYYLLDLLTIIP